jgi:hypothetical protein
MPGQSVVAVVAAVLLSSSLLVAVESTALSSVSALNASKVTLRPVKAKANLLQSKPVSKPAALVSVVHGPHHRGTASSKKHQVARGAKKVHTKVATHAHPRAAAPEAAIAAAASLESEDDEEEADINLGSKLMDEGNELRETRTNIASLETALKADVTLLRTSSKMVSMAKSKVGRAAAEKQTHRTEELVKVTGAMLKESRADAALDAHRALRHASAAREAADLLDGEAAAELAELGQKVEPYLMDSYSASGCRQSPELPAAGTASDDTTEDALSMTVQKCFAFCSQKSAGGEARYFGITAGKTCWCTELIDAEIDSKQCDTPCPGNDDQTCGGVAGAASVYVMFGCKDKTTAQKTDEKETADARILASYSMFPEQSCAQGPKNGAEIDQSATMVASVDNCKRACWLGSGSAKCHGFTFEEGMGRCTFHSDVTDGTVKEEEKMSCYFKKSG